MSEDKETEKRITRLETVIDQHEERLKSLENHISELSRNVTKLDEDVKWIKEQLKSLDKKMWGILSGVITIIILIIKVML